MTRSMKKTPISVLRKLFQTSAKKNNVNSWQKAPVLRSILAVTLVLDTEGNTNVCPASMKNVLKEMHSSMESTETSTVQCAI